MGAELFLRLDRWLASNRTEYYARLQFGVTEAALAAFEARFALTLPLGTLREPGAVAGSTRPLDGRRHPGACLNAYRLC